MTRLRATFASLSGRADDRIVGFLLCQLDATAEGVALCRATVTGGLGPEAAHLQMSAVEHDGDVQRGNLVDELSGALGTSIDREDLFRLSRSIDDVLDGLRDFVREFALFEVWHSTNAVAFAEFIDAVGSAVDALRTAVAGISETNRLPEDVLAAKKAASALRRLYQNAMAGQLTGALDATTLTTIELMRRLDAVGACLGAAADALADGALKRWH